MQVTRIASLAIFSVASLWGAQSLLASSLYVANNSFESPAEAYNNASSTNGDANNAAVTGYTDIGPSAGSGGAAGAFNVTPPAGPSPIATAPAGNQVLYIGLTDSTSPVGVSQALVNSATDSSAYHIVAGEAYSLSVDIGKRADTNNTDSNYSVFFTANGSQVGVALSGNTSTLTTPNGTLESDLSPATYVGTPGAAGEQLGFVIEQTSVSSTISQVLFDDVVINGSVPEPASLALVALAIPMVLRRKRAAR